MRSSFTVPSHLAAILVAAGCNVSPSVGDPCVPESKPMGGFDGREIYVESSSAQCRTSTCLVYRLAGDPTVLCDADGNPPGCTTLAQQDSQAFCSCRCSVLSGDDSSTPLCECGPGFRCDGQAASRGERGIRGGYCVPCIEPGNPRGLDTAVFESCPA